FRRAPAWMRRLGIEWTFRFIQEPGRLWKRYLIGNLTFESRVLLYAMTAKRRAGKQIVNRPVPMVRPAALLSEPALAANAGD
ncbi:MAG TPA: WecB/TagA/CpsF family glycosyltransferase, partial [Ktedonobacterales bacterium]|nr:WecB/TagA/CpsF family glycosyltransferase [Ktedonobacterales bacterium]